VISQQYSHVAEAEEKTDEVAGVVTAKETGKETGKETAKASNTATWTEPMNVHASIVIDTLALLDGQDILVTLHRIPESEFACATHNKVDPDKSGLEMHICV